MYCSPVRMRCTAASSASWPVTGFVAGSMPADFIAAMKGAGLNPANVPVTGQDAELAAIQRILAGQQYMTVYKAVKPEAGAAAEIAVALAKGQKVRAGLVNQKVNNGQKDVPSVILKPVAVTKANVKDTVIKDGYQKPSQVCTGQYASACKAAGIGV